MRRALSRLRLALVILHGQSVRGGRIRGKSLLPHASTLAQITPKFECVLQNVTCRYIRFELIEYSVHIHSEHCDFLPEASPNPLSVHPLRDFAISLSHICAVPSPIPSFPLQLSFVCTFPTPPFPSTTPGVSTYNNGPSDWLWLSVVFVLFISITEMISTVSINDQIDFYDRHLTAVFGHVGRHGYLGTTLFSSEAMFVVIRAKPGAWRSGRCSEG